MMSRWVTWESPAAHVQAWVFCDGYRASLVPTFLLQVPYALATDGAVFAFDGAKTWHLAEKSNGLSRLEHITDGS